MKSAKRGAKGAILGSFFEISLYYENTVESKTKLRNRHYHFAGRICKHFNLLETKIVAKGAVIPYKPAYNKQVLRK